MKHDTRSVLVGFLSAFLLVALVAFIGASVYADGGPSRQDLGWLEAIKLNQMTLAETRDAHDRFEMAVTMRYTIEAEDLAKYNAFVTAAVDNEYKVKALGKDGFSVDWKSLTLVPSSF